MSQRAGRNRTDADFRHRVRLLKAVASGTRQISVGPDKAVVAGAGGRSKSVALPRPVWDAAVADGLVLRADGGRVGLSETGRAFLRRALSEGDGFADQHRRTGVHLIEQPDGRRVAVTVNEAESPLAWLRRRRNRAGDPFLTDAQFAAGERLRCDFTKGQMLPRTTANWSAAISPRRRRSGERGGASDLTDAALSARDRVRRAVEAVGPELSGVLIDVCCFLKGIETVERERDWPTRSGKIVLALALARLERHYAGDRAGARGRRWRGEDDRPAIDAAAT